MNSWLHRSSWGQHQGNYWLQYSYCFYLPWLSNIVIVNDCVCGVNIIYSIDKRQCSLIYCHLLLVRMNKLIGSREQMMKECQELSSHLDEFNSPIVFCHNDLMSKNMRRESILDYSHGNRAAKYSIIRLVNHMAFAWTLLWGYTSIMHCHHIHIINTMIHCNLMNS